MNRPDSYFRFAFLLFIIATLSGCAALVRPPVAFNPENNWHELNTEHFRIISIDKKLATEAAIIAEETHQQFLRYFHDFPKEKTTILIEDSNDEVFGLALLVPSNTIYINPTEPFILDELLPLSYQNWLRAIIVHEYAHIVHLDDVELGYQIIRNVFGRIILPNTMQPKWIIEGFATYVESNMEESNRGSGTFSDMILRMAALEGNMPSIDRADGTSKWPMGRTPYYFGSRFFKYIQKQYGDKKLKELLKEYSSAFPLTFHRNARKVLRRSISGLWGEWQTFEMKKAEDFTAKTTLTESRKLTGTGYLTTCAKPSPDGKRIVYTVSDNEHSYITIADIQQDNNGIHFTNKKLLPIKNTSCVSFSPDSKSIAFSQKDFINNYTFVSDIYTYNLETKETIRLTAGKRAHMPSFSPDGTKLVYTESTSTKSTLKVIDIESKTSGSLDIKINKRLSHPTWGKKGILFSSYKEGISGIYRFKPNQSVNFNTLPKNKPIPGNTIKIIEDNNLNIYPTWGFNDDIIFSSDKDGSFNIYSQEIPKTKSDSLKSETTKLTSVAGGAFMPAIYNFNNDKQLIFTGYSSQGFDIHSSTPANIKYENKHLNIKTKKAENQRSLSAKQLINTKPYTLKAKELIPTFWIPYSDIYNEQVEYGFFTGSYDSLGKHAYSLYTLFGAQKNVYELTYTYKGLKPIISLGIYDIATGYTNMPFLIVKNSVLLPYWERTRGAFLGITFFNRIKNRNISITLKRELIDPLNIPANPVIKKDLLNLATIFYSYGKSFNHSATKSSILGLFFKVEKAFQFSSSPEYNRYLASSTLRGDTPLINDSRFYLKSTFAMMTGNVPLQKLFVLSPPQAGDDFAGADSRRIKIRGYRRLWGEKIAFFTVENNFKIYQIDRGIGMLPIFLKSINLKPFFETGNIWSRDFGSFAENIKSSFGYEIIFDMITGYAIPIQFKIGYAKGQGKHGINQRYLFFTSSIF